MKELQVTCINKPDRDSSFEHITHIGNNMGGWKYPRNDAIRMIDSGEYSFYTLDPTTNKKVYIAVVRGDGNKAPYLRTHADGYWNNNLLSLAECKDNCKVF